MRSARATLLSWCLLPCCAVADTTLIYRGDDGCAGDFDRMQMKDAWLRMDTRQGADSSMIYDGSEKLVTFADHGQHRFLQAEIDEDAIDLQKDIMESLRKKMRKETGFDALEMARSLCPGIDAADPRDRLPDDPACGMASGAAMIEADGTPMDAPQVAAATKNGQMPAIDADSQKMMQLMLQKQMASMPPGQQAQMQQVLGSMLPSHAAKAPARAEPRVDRDAGEARVGGIACQRRQHLRGEQLLREDCYAPIAALQLDPREATRIARFSTAMQAWSGSFDSGETRRPVADRALIQRTCYRNGHEGGRTTLHVDHASIPESAFALPEGYAPFDTGMRQSPGSR
jgi:hypothetical protein